MILTSDWRVLFTGHFSAISWSLTSSSSEKLPFIWIFFSITSVMENSNKWKARSSIWIASNSMKSNMGGNLVKTYTNTKLSFWLFFLSLFCWLLVPAAKSMAHTKHSRSCGTSSRFTGWYLSFCLFETGNLYPACSTRPSPTSLRTMKISWKSQSS